MHVEAAKLADNLRLVHQRMAAAARRVHRQPEEIKLIAITKYVDANVAASLVDAGCQDLGESRPQELWRKAESLGGRATWHLVGHLQRNKVRRTLPLVSMIHSGDSLPLLDDLHAQTSALSLPAAPSILLEVNISGDAAKHGFSPSEMPEVIRHVATLNQLRVCGLMAMAGLEGDSDAARSDFRRLRELRDQLQSIAPPQVSLHELSMGMSGDFEVAIEEGSTMVRIGSALFEGIDM